MQGLYTKTQRVKKIICIEKSDHKSRHLSLDIADRMSTDGN